MLPFALKVVWFCLSFTGTIACWVVLYALSRAISCYWILMTYPVFTTLLEGIFCLGMIYDMNPLQMPEAFCIVQTFVIYYSAWSLTGVCAAFTFATAGSVLWPSCTPDSAASTVVWKNKYYLPILVFPLACLSISVPVLLSMDAIQPTDDLHCDASHPEWGRFLGYAGFSMILTIPCFFLSASAARRIIQTHFRSQRTRWSFRIDTGRLHLGSKENHERNVTLERPASPHISSPDTKTPASVSPEILQSLPSTGATFYVDPDVSPSTTLDALSSSQKRSEASEAMSTIEEGYEFHPRGQMGDVMLSSTSHDVPPPLPNLAPAIWRLILFQMMYFTIQFLAALSTIIDVARRRPTPTPFGSQHVALVLVGWGPAIVFGHLPAVRGQLMFWKK